MTAQVNKRFKVGKGEPAAELALGWGPAEIKKQISLPSWLRTPIRVKRQMWILYNIYKFMVTAPAWGQQMERVVLSAIPERLRDSIGHIEWNEYRNFNGRRVWQRH